MPAGVGFKVLKVGQWTQASIALRVLSSHTMIQSALERAAFKEAQRARVALVKGVQSGAPGGKAFTPLAESTLTVRRFKGGRGGKASKPLMRTGALLRAFVAKRVRGQGSFAGILRSARGKGGEDLFNLMSIHEGGKTIAIKVTPPMHRFLMAAFRGKRKQRRAGVKGAGGLTRGIIIVRIPPRPVFKPVWEAWFKPGQVRRRMSMSIALELKAAGKLGIV